jgi:hypothetical protein
MNEPSECAAKQPAREWAGCHHLEIPAGSGRSGQLDVLALQATGLGTGWTLTVVGFFQFAMSFCHDDAIRETFLSAAVRQGRRNILETGKDTVSLATGKPPSVALEPVFAKTGG